MEWVLVQGRRAAQHKPGGYLGAFAQHWNGRSFISSVLHPSWVVLTGRCFEEHPVAAGPQGGHELGWCKGSGQFRSSSRHRSMPSQIWAEHVIWSRRGFFIAQLFTSTVKPSPCQQEQREVVPRGGRMRDTEATDLCPCPAMFSSLDFRCR